MVLGRLELLPLSCYTQSMSEAQLLEQIKQLPRAERAELILEAMESLEDPTPEEYERLWAAEIDHRVADYLSGKVKGIPLEEVT